MAWQDRDYNSGFTGRRFSNPIWNLLLGSVTLGHIFGIRVRVHATFIWFVVFTLLTAPASGIPTGLAMKNAAVGMTILFVLVLLHEFGHCFTARWVGGEADNILMSPLGGLAFVRPPHRPLPTFLTVLGGPMVNVVVCIITAALLYGITRNDMVIPWNPLRPKLVTMYMPHNGIAYYLWWIYIVSYALLLFNVLLPFYPFDGGQMIQAILWPHLGYRHR